MHGAVLFAAPPFGNGLFDWVELRKNLLSRKLPLTTTHTRGREFLTAVEVRLGEVERARSPSDAQGAKEGKGVRVRTRTTVMH